MLVSVWRWTLPPALQRWSTPDLVNPGQATYLPWASVFWKGGAFEG